MPEPDLSRVWDTLFEPDIRDYHIRVAREELSVAQSRGFAAKPRRIIDIRRFDVPESSVRKYGVIEYAEPVPLPEIVRWIWDDLHARSPVRRGLYRASHLLMINGVEVPPSAIETLRQGDKVEIVNATPYARKIDRGLSKMARSGVYRLTYRLAQSRFGKLAWIEYNFVKLNLGVTVMGLEGGGYYAKGRYRTRKFDKVAGLRGTSRQRIRRAQVYPAILIRQMTAGAVGSA